MSNEPDMTAEGLALDVGTTLVWVCCEDGSWMEAALPALMADPDRAVPGDVAGERGLLFARPLDAVEYALALLESAGGQDLRVGVLHLGSDTAAGAVTRRDRMRAQLLSGEAPCASMALCLRSYCAASPLLLRRHWFVAVHGSEINNEVERVVATRIPSALTSFSTFAGLGAGSDAGAMPRSAGHF